MIYVEITICSNFIFINKKNIERSIFAFMLNDTFLFRKLLVNTIMKHGYCFIYILKLIWNTSHFFSVI